MIMRLAIVILALMLGSAAMAVEPDEVLSDPVLEARARALSQDLRCPVCQGESIDESDAGIARDLRMFLRARLQAGDSDDQVLAAITQRYGEFVRFRPDPRGVNVILYAAGPVVFVAILLAVAVWMRRRAAGTVHDPDLSENEAKRLNDILNDD